MSQGTARITDGLREEAKKIEHDAQRISSDSEGEAFDNLATQIGLLRADLYRLVAVLVEADQEE